MDRLKELLIRYGCPSDVDMVETAFVAKECSYKRLRDVLIQLGTILEEVESEKIYLAAVKAGVNHAVVAACLQDDNLRLVAYAKEGILYQNTASKAIDKIKDFITSPSDAKRQKKNQHSSKHMFVAVMLLLLACIVGAVLISAMVACDTIEKYNVATDNFNALADEYNSIASGTSLDNIEGIFTSVGKINREKDSLLEGVSVVFGKNSVSKIDADTKTIYELIEQLEHSKKIIEQITAPGGQWVEERIKNVEGVTGTQAVTETDNPDGLLNKEGGYTACIYFTLEKIDIESVAGESIVDKGTDAGGAVEVYATLKEAEARCEYLSGFDGTILYSGSYAIVGTTVIRTSYKLNNEEQFELTNKITQALTKVE